MEGSAITQLVCSTNAKMYVGGRDSQGFRSNCNSVLGVLLTVLYEAAYMALLGHRKTIEDSMFPPIGKSLHRRLCNITCKTDKAVMFVGTKLPPLKIPKPQKASAWALRESEFGAGLVGGKSGNLAKLRGKLPESIAVPASVALPFGTFERVLKDDVNKEAAAAVAELQRKLVQHCLSPMTACMLCCGETPVFPQTRGIEEHGLNQLWYRSTLVWLVDCSTTHITALHTITDSQLVAQLTSRSVSTFGNSTSLQSL